MGLSDGLLHVGQLLNAPLVRGIGLRVGAVMLITVYSTHRQAASAPAAARTPLRLYL
jgi:hypothetical protein